MEYFAKLFPVERGYSNWLRHKDDDPDKPMSYQEWLAGPKKNDTADGSDGSGESEAAEGASTEEGNASASNSSQAEIKPPSRPHGRGHPMIFGDLGTVAGRGPAQKSPNGAVPWWQGAGKWRKSHGIRRR